MKRSSPLIADETVDDVIELLRSSGVVLANDPLRDPALSIIRAPLGEFSREDLLAKAQNAGATHLMILTVDRPFAGWLKLKLECFDGAGKLLWKEEASYGRGATGASAVTKTLEKLKRQLQPRLGQPGLPLAAQSQGSSQQPEPSTSAPQESPYGVPDNEAAQAQGAPSSSDTPALPQAQSVSTPERAKVHVTSSPTGGEIYVDGKFFGNTPSDITLPAGEHVMKITIGDKEWSRSIEITPGEITVHADVAAK